MYGRSSSGPQYEIRRFFVRGGIPVTLALIISNVITFFVVHSTGGVIIRYLAFSTALWPQYFWTFLTWPLISVGDPINLLFALGWVYTFGGSLERSWGTRVYGQAVAAAAAITAIAMWLGCLLPFVPGGGLAGLWVMGGIMTVAFGFSNRGEVINFWGLPLPMPALIILGCAMTWFYAGAMLVGVFALTSCAAAYLYVTQWRHGGAPGFRIGGARRSSTAEPNLRFRDFEREVLDGSNRSRRGFSLSRWWRERQERRRLEQMFRRSGYTDPEERRRR